MTVTTTAARVMLAIDLAQKYSSLYFGIGQASAWGSNDTPPAEGENSNSIANPIAFFRASFATLCRPLQQNEAVPTDAIQWGGNTYVRVTVGNAYAQEATYIYVEGALTKSGVSTSNVTYRTTGVYVGIVPKAGVTKPVLLPSDIATQGTLLSYSNKIAQVLDDETSYKAGALYHIARIEE